jgi:pyrroline-5-carboxylate reductase
MGSAMLRGWAQTMPQLDLTLFEPVPNPDLAELVGAHGWKLNPDIRAGEKMDVVIIGVKPQSFAIACEQTLLAITGPDTLVISIMAGFSTARIGADTGAQRVIRAMPNTPGQIGLGITAYVLGQGATDEDEAFAVDLLRPLGSVEKLATEKQMDAVTALSGSGPAYVFLLAEAMAAAGEGIGLERSMAERLAWQTVIGSGALMQQTGKSPLELRRAVTSPGGTTAAAVDVLTAGSGLAKMMRRAVEAAAQRSRQLGK